MPKNNSSGWGWFWGGSAGLAVIILCSLLMLPLALFTTGAARIIFSLAFILFFPGYTLITALFPAKGRLDGIERLALSFGLSLAVVPLIGLVLNFTPWGIRFEPILFSLFAFIIIMASIALYRRSRIAAEERFEVDFGAAAAAVYGGWAGKGRLDQVLTAVLAVAILGTIGAIVYTVVNPHSSELFTEFYILGTDGKADNYPTEVIAGTNATVIAGIVNHEGENVTYSVEVDVNGTAVEDIGNITLAGEAKWEQPISFNATLVGTNESIQYLLFRSGNTTPYRELHLWLDVKEK